MRDGYKLVIESYENGKKGKRISATSDDRNFETSHQD